MITEILSHDATAQAVLVGRREVSAAELLDAAIAAADAADIGHAIPIRFDAIARERAGGPLAGPHRRTRHAGYPATLPAVPIGVQFVARFGAESVLSRLAAQRERVAPWAGRRTA